MQNSDLTVIFDLDGTIYQTMYANSEDFQVLAITTMVGLFVAKWYDQQKDFVKAKRCTR